MATVSEVDGGYRQDILSDRWFVKLRLTELGVMGNT